MSTPWKTVVKAADVQNLSDIISEEYAKGLRVKKEKQEQNFDDNNYEIMSNSAVPITLEHLDQDKHTGEDDYCHSDSIIAAILQSEFDKVHDDKVHTMKNMLNGKKKLTITGKSYNILPIRNNHDHEQNTYDKAEKYDSQYFETDKSKSAYVPKHNYDLKDKAKLTKHIKINSRRIACNLLDEPTRLILSKLINNGELKSINGIICIGKKSIILHATATRGPGRSIHEECAIKIFKTTPNKFKAYDKFINNDLDFKNPQEIARTWAEREMHNMRQLYFEDYPKLLFRRVEPYIMTKWVDRYNKRTLPKEWPNSYHKLDFDALYELYNRGHWMQNVTCASNELYWENTSIREMQMARPPNSLSSPRLRFRTDHVLLMTFIGHHTKPASKLRDVTLTPEEWQIAYNKVVDAMHALYHSGRLIHGHLCANNILWWKNTCWFIDFSQAVQRDHPNGYKFLLRDCRKICDFFINKGIRNMKHTEELFEWITGYEVAHFGKA